MGATRILTNVSLSLPKGTITTLLGPNGAGKTSLLRCLSLLATPSAGDIAILDRHYSFPMPRAPAPPWPMLTVVFQSLHLWPHLTVAQNVALPARLSEGSSRGQVVDRLSQFELTDLADRFPSEISGGERQRTAIARALALHPTMKILLLDEPTSATDVEHAMKLSTILKSEASRGLTILLVTHLIGFARLISDRVLFIDRGEIVAAGGAEIIEKPPSARMRAFVSVF